MIERGLLVPKLPGQSLPKCVHECCRRGDIWTVAGVKVIDLPAGFLSGAVCELSERLLLGVARAVNVRAWHGQLCLQVERLIETPNRLRHPVLADPLQIFL